MKKKYTTKAIILQGKNYGEADKIVVAFTKDRGRVDFFARGVRKIKSKNRALLQPFTYSELEFVEGKGLDILTQGVLIESFSSIRKNFDHIVECSFMAEYLIQVLEVYDPYVDLCYQFLLALNYLDKKKPTGPVVLVSFLIKSFNLLGYGPLMETCAACQKTHAQAGGLAYFFSEGMLLCPDCAQGVGFSLSEEDLKLYQLLAAANYKKDLCHLEAHPSLKKVQGLVEEMMFYILERDHKSTRFIEKLKKMRF